LGRGEEVKKCNDNIRTAEVKLVELNVKKNSEISNLKAQTAEGSTISNRPAAVAEVGQATEAGTADIGPTTPICTGVEQRSTRCVGDCNILCTNTTHFFNIDSVQGHADVNVHSDLG
jgi:hypothetical protein